MPSKKTKLSQKLNKRGRPKKIVKKTTSDESTSNQNGDVLEIDNVMTNTVCFDRIATLFIYRTSSKMTLIGLRNYKRNFKKPNNQNESFTMH
jgi:hypothetical protein